MVLPNACCVVVPWYAPMVRAAVLMSLRCLLFSHDERSVRLLRLSLGDLDVEVEHSTDVDHGQKLLLQSKFDAVVADCDLDTGPALLQTVRRSKHNKRSIIFALAGEQIKMGAAFELGADFVIYKPLSTERVKRTLHAAHGLMMREKRLHFRHPTSTPVTLYGGQRPLRAELCDLSPHGALVNAGTPMKKDQLVQMTFTLPDTSYAMNMKARVTRSDPLGRTGLRFESMSPETESRLMEWAVERSIETVRPEDAALANASDSVESEPIAIAELPSDVDFEVEVIESSGDADLEARHRATLRGEHHANIKVLIFDDGSPIILEAKCRNISELGMAAKIDDDLSIGTAALLQVELPGSPEPIVLHARVRRQEKNLYGFEFVAVEPAAQQLLREGVKDLPVE